MIVNNRTVTVTLPMPLTRFLRLGVGVQVQVDDVNTQTASLLLRSRHASSRVVLFIIDHDKQVNRAPQDSCDAQLRH